MNPQDPYGVPTGYVPRESFSGYVRTEPVAAALDNHSTVLVDMRTGRWAPAVDKAVDDYLLMERKARAWDELRAEVLRWARGHDRELVLELMDKIVHPAQPSAR